jgi:hypothetical protein
MRRLVFAALGTTVIAGCALVIDLGDEPALYSSDAAPLPDSAIQDSAIQDAGSDASEASAAVNACGLPPSSNAVCEQCINESCCDTAKACGASPNCVKGLECIKDCLVQQSCIFECFKQFPEVQDMATCSAFTCAKCTPGPECQTLGRCVFNLPTTDFRRQVEKGRILDLDETVCKTARQNVVSDGVADAGACYQ